MTTLTSPLAVSPDGGQACQVLGSVTRLVLQRAETGGGITLLEVTDHPGGGVPLHVHAREDETFIVVEGLVEFTVNGAPTLAGPGMVVWAPRNQPHAYRMAGDTPSRMYVAVTPSGIEEMFKELDAMPPGPPDFATIAEICGRHGVTLL